MAACGVPLVAARGGRVITSSYDDVLYGWHVIIHNAREHRDYWYSHLIRRPLVRRGQDVRTGRHLGDVGATGNARSVGCHLHFEIHQHRTPIDPAPSLHAWDAWS
jgi:murein DD-endopeptidase MepM/ murein hydrolase activator NlpD